MGSDEWARLKKYTFFGCFWLAGILGVIFFLTIFMSSLFAAIMPINVWAECGDGMANIFIGANTELKEVKCVALEKELIDKKEFVVGDLVKNDEDVCKFKLLNNTEEPIRFEVHYNGITKREVCNNSGINQAYID